MNVITRLFTHAKGLCLLTAALALGGVAQAATFDFSYTFGDGTFVNGSFEGTQNGSYIDNVSNISLYINSTQVTGTIFGAQYDESNFTYLPGPIFSLNPTLSNFVFANSDIVNGFFDYSTSFFQIAPSGASTQMTAVSYELGVVAFESAADLQAVTITVTNSSNNVPDGAATAGLLGVAALGLVALRRRFAA